MYIEFHSRSAFSFLEGASLPEELAGVCAHLGMPAMALLDTDGVYGAPRFHLATKKIGLKAHIGAEVAASFFSPRSHDETQRKPINNQKSASKTSRISLCLSVSVVNSVFLCWSPPVPATRISAA